MKLANGLSLLRLVLAPPLLVLLLWQPPSGFLAATGVWFISSWSDVFDGYFARRRAAVSKVGVFVDLVADKLVTSSVLIAFVDLDLIPTWPAAVILGREFIITGFRTFAAAEGVVIPAAGWGKQKTVVTNLALGMMMLWGDHRYGGVTAGSDILGAIFSVGPWLFYLSVALTVTSGVMYLWSGRGILDRIRA